MSASLVGSEMCIRDRRGALLLPGPACGARSAPRCGVGSRYVGAAGPGRCLLYTSDAADDM
eukprot:9484424-Alexandrium_andersonii.AAC.1